MVLVLEARCDRGLARVGLSVYPLAACAGTRRSTGRRGSSARTNPSVWLTSSLPRWCSLLAVTALPYHMPVALSSHFDLRVEVLSSMKDLAKIHIAGHPLIGDPSSKPRGRSPLQSVASTPNPGIASASSAKGHELALWIDGRQVAVAS